MRARVLRTQLIYVAAASLQLSGMFDIRLWGGRLDIILTAAVLVMAWCRQEDTLWMGVTAGIWMALFGGEISPLTIPAMTGGALLTSYLKNRAFADSAVMPALSALSVNILLLPASMLILSGQTSMTPAHTGTIFWDHLFNAAVVSVAGVLTGWVAAPRRTTSYRKNGLALRERG